MSKTTKLAALKKKPAPVNADEWVGASTPDVSEGQGSNVTTLEQPAEPMKRFTIDVNETLHKRIKAECARRGQKMADVIRDLLEREFPKNAA